MKKETNYHNTLYNILDLSNRNVLTSIAKNVKRNVTIGVGVGNMRKVCSCTSPPVITADSASFNHPKRFHITDSTFSTPIYSAQPFAAQ